MILLRKQTVEEFRRLFYGLSTLCLIVGLANGQDSVYSKPCSDAPPSCDLPCPNGYFTVPSGCQQCRCAEYSPSASLDTSTSTARPVDTITDEECFSRLLDCTLRNPFGFMSDKTCHMCVGKDDIYALSGISEERQPRVRLLRPCIQGFDLCMIVCSSGYRSGPRDCQFCSCNS